MNKSELATSDPVTNERREQESDMDALHVLPLNIIPFELLGLKRAKLIKNVRLETVIEMFRDASTGSGQVRVEEAAKILGIAEEEPHPDLIKLRSLSDLNSFDVFTLRLELRNAGVALDEHAELKLSKSKNKELTDYMSEFTRPLISQVYSGSNTDITDVNQIIDMFKHPDHGQAAENLRKLATTLNLTIPEIPRFLEDYGDIFLSVAYFKNCFEIIIPIILEFTESMEKLRINPQIKEDKIFINNSLFIENTLNNVTLSITNRFDSFQRHSNEMWNDINAESFSRVKELISSHHSTIGGVLCGLAVKMSMWNELFAARRGSPQARADFVLHEMLPGIEKIAEVEASAPKSL
tara:strand:+ start:3518 stop:4573 length:1056 start_codon:yes stop_codon:yes gene_type:complete